MEIKTARTTITDTRAKVTIDRLLLIAERDGCENPADCPYVALGHLEARVLLARELAAQASRGTLFDAEGRVITAISEELATHTPTHTHTPDPEGGLRMTTTTTYRETTDSPADRPRRVFDDHGYMFIHGSAALPPDEQVEDHYWFVECPGEYRIYFEDLNQADDWVWWQQQTGLSPDDMDHDEMAAQHEVDGYYMDLR